MDTFKKGWEKAARQARKESGAYDGRFSPKVYKDRYHVRDKYLCRDNVEVPSEEEEFQIKPSPHRI